MNSRGLVREHKPQVRPACLAAGFSRTAWYRRPRDPPARDSARIDALHGVVEKHASWGFWKCYDRLRLDGQRRLAIWRATIWSFSWASSRLASGKRSSNSCFEYSSRLRGPSNTIGARKIRRNRSDYGGPTGETTSIANP
jgi:hypothetical protein